MDQLIAIGIGAFTLILTIGGLILGLLRRGERSGKLEAENESLRKGAKESNDFADRVASGHAAAGRVRDYANDPNDRANRRKGGS